ncbi:MAG: TolC family outer membrane protein [Gammaproteobacteria bacterium]|nr:TolC family outer membrane protein [Gammaproteobacteria bacterium]MDH4313594.1 TolC family outer membrane protein [Gammaproteobacteria bacterium]
MKRLSRIRHLALCALMVTVAPLAQATSLLEVYQQALQSDPLIHEADARRLAAAEAAPQARSLLLPQIEANAGYTNSQASGTQLILDNSAVTRPPFSADLDNETWDLGLRQSIFRWDQIVGLRQANKLVARAEADYEAAQQDLMIRVAQRYFDVLAAEDVLTSIHANRLAIARQLDQAKQRFEVGLIAITDVQESQAAHDQAVADEIGAKRTLATAREFLREITGEYVTSLAAPTDQFPLVSPSPADEASWVDLAMSQNLAVISSRLGEQVARDEISFRRTGHYPTIELVAGRRFNEQTGTQTFSPAPPLSQVVTPADTNSLGNSISVQLNLPIFSGGRTSSRVREAVYLHRASREQLQRVARETERQTRDAYLGVLAEISRVQALQQAVESSRTALEATEAGFEVGTRTIVDVLNSQFSVYAAITNYYRSRYAYIGNVLRLKQAAGMLQVQDLEDIDKWLSERKPPEQAIREETAGEAES